jgi:hypothetical protein
MCGRRSQKEGQRRGQQGKTHDKPPNEKTTKGALFGRSLLLLRSG